MQTIQSMQGAVRPPNRPLPAQSGDYGANKPWRPPSTVPPTSFSMTMAEPKDENRKGIP
jgi:hypothetical protein